MTAHTPPLHVPGEARTTAANLALAGRNLGHDDDVIRGVLIDAGLLPRPRNHRMTCGHPRTELRRGSTSQRGSWCAACKREAKRAEEVGMTRPKLLDLFSGEGGAGVGYARAGFDVYAVDNDPKRLAANPCPSHLGDVIEVMAALLRGRAVDFWHKDGRVEWMTLADFDAIHASPTCTGYSRGTAAIPDRLTRYDRLISVTRALILETGLPYVIENVADARGELRTPTLLCWSMFNEPGSVIDDDGTPLRMERHRLFESNVTLTPPAACNHPRSVQVAGAYGGARRDKVEAREIRKGGYVPASLGVLRRLLDTPWMTERGCFLSIPPAYTEHIGAQLIDHLRSAAA